MIKHVLVAAGVLALPGFANAATVSVTCNGSDVAALLNSYATITGETINFSAGTCDLSAMVTILANNVTFNGATSTGGAPITFIEMQGDTTQTDAFDVGTSHSNAFTGTTFQNIVVDCNLQPTDYYTQTVRGIFTSANSNNTTVNNVTVQHCMGGVTFSGSNSIVENSLIQLNNANGIFIQGVFTGGVNYMASNDTVINNRVWNNNQENGNNGPAGKTWDGIDADNWSNGGLIKNNWVIGQDIIVHCTAGQGYPNVDGWIVVGNSVSFSNKSGADMAGSCVTNFTLTGNMFVQDWLFSVVVGAAQGTVSNNFMLSGGPYTIRAGSTVNSVGNVVY